MLSKHLSFERLSSPPNNASFDCGDADLNDFFYQDAFLSQEQLLTVTYLFHHIQNKDIVAYFSVLNDSIETNNKLNRKIPNEKRHRKIPAVKLGRLAINKKYHRAGFGSEILGFIKYLFVYKNKTGCRFLLADAYNRPGVLAFYKKNGFDFLTKTDEEKETRAMKFDLKPYELRMRELKIL